MPLDQPSDRTLLFPLDTMISPTEFENPTSDASSGERTQKKRKRGLGKGGAAANYCTMSVASRMAQFPNEPVEKLNHKIFRAFLRKYTTVEGCLSELGGEFPKHNCVRLQDGHHRIIAQKLRGEPVVLMFDEWTDERGVAVLGVVAQCRKLKFCIDVKFLEGKGPNNGVEHTEVASAMIAALATVSIHPDQVQFCIMDEGSVMVAAGDHILKKVWKNSMWFLRHIHIPLGRCQCMP